MPTSPLPATARGNGGFTMIEVLFAFVILAVGLLSLEALGIGASRLVARADRQTVYTTRATARLEQALSAVRQSQPVDTRSDTLPGALLTVRGPFAANGLRTVIVTVMPSATNGVLAPRDSLVFSGSVFVP